MDSLLGVPVRTVASPFAVSDFASKLARTQAAAGSRRPLRQQPDAILHGCCASRVHTQPIDRSERLLSSI